LRVRFTLRLKVLQRRPRPVDHQVRPLDRVPSPEQLGQVPSPVRLVQVAQLPAQARPAVWLALFQQ
jgi:hypothetical protein